MNWKGFLKPTPSKTIITILLLVVSFWFYYTHVTSYEVMYELRPGTECPSYYECYACGGNFLNSIGYVIDLPWLVYSLAYDASIRHGICVPYPEYFYSWPVIFQVLYFYLISCIIVFVYVKISGGLRHRKRA